LEDGGVSLCINYSLVFAVRLWELEGNTLSQGSCEVQSTIGAFQLVALLRSDNSDSLMHSSCVNTFDILSGYITELLSLNNCPILVMQ
jgi:hypothetical protein